jgi:beta-mannosidase
MALPEVPPGFTSIPAMVPGNVELDLIEAGLLPRDLDRGQNAYLVKPYETYQWWYRRTFEVNGLSRFGAPLLVLKGVDTVASVWLNGIKLARLDNMLIPHRLDIDGVLKEGLNELVVAIDSPVIAALACEIDVGAWAMENNWESLHIRKPPHAYGWDIMPRMLSAGLWRDVYIESRKPYRFKNVYLATLGADATKGTAELLVRWSIATPGHAGETCKLTLRITDPATGKHAYERTARLLGKDGEFRAGIEDVGLWYPRGYGRPDLYSVELLLENDRGNTLADWRSLFGFRTARLIRTDTIDDDGNGEFVFLVNGVKMFVKGSNWVPLDALHSRDAGHLDATLRPCGRSQLQHDPVLGRQRLRRHAVLRLLRSGRHFGLAGFCACLCAVSADRRVPRKDAAGGGGRRSALPQPPIPGPVVRQ